MPVESIPRNNDVLVFNLPSKMKEQAKAIAQYNQVSVNRLMRSLLSEYIKKNPIEWRAVSHVEQ